MRFNNNAWQEVRFSDIYEISNGINKDKESFGYGFPIVNYMDVNKNIFISKENICGKVNSSKTERKTYSVETTDILLTRTSETKEEIAYASCLTEKIDDCVFSGFLLRARPKNDQNIPMFIAYLLRSNKYRKELMKLSTMTSRALINSDNLGRLQIRIPDQSTQIKISKTLKLIDQQINTQSKILEQIKSQIKSICHIMCNINDDTVKLKEVCFFENKTNHQSGEGVSSGKYIYFTNEEETNKYFNSYDFDGEYIIANTGGKANFKYYNGKFASMSDCLVVKCFENVKTKFILYSLLNCIEKINHIGFVGSGLKHLDKDWFENMSIPQYSIAHDKYLKLIDTLTLKLECEELLLKKIKEQKKYLLSNMFI